MAALSLPLPTRAEAIAQRSGEARAAACDRGVDALRGRNSRWPVDTGRSKRAWQRVGNEATSEIFNPLHYASFVEDGIPNKRTRNAGRRTLNAAEPQIVRAARAGPGSAAAERSALSREAILQAAAARERLEEEQKLYDQYVANLEKRGLRAPTIPASIRDLDRRIRQAAS